MADCTVELTLHLKHFPAHHIRTVAQNHSRGHGAHVRGTGGRDACVLQLKPRRAVRRVGGPQPPHGRAVRQYLLAGGFGSPWLAAGRDPRVGIDASQAMRTYARSSWKELVLFTRGMTHEAFGALL